MRMDPAADRYEIATAASGGVVTLSGRCDGLTAAEFFARSAIADRRYRSALLSNAISLRSTQSPGPVRNSDYRTASTP
jgi:hypothetical protein